MMNLGDFKPGPIDRKSLPLEDRWILSKLLRRPSKSLSCSWNLSMPKQPGWLMSSRGATSAAITSKSPSHGCKMPMPRHWSKSLGSYVGQFAQAIASDDSVRHRSHWQQLAKFGTIRLLDSNVEATQWIMKADWPTQNPADVDTNIEEQFSKFAMVVGALRETRVDRTSQGNVRVFCSMPWRHEEVARADASIRGIDGRARNVRRWMKRLRFLSFTARRRSKTSRSLSIYRSSSISIRKSPENEKLLANLIKQIQGKEGKLSNETFVSRAPVDVVRRSANRLPNLSRSAMPRIGLFKVFGRQEVSSLRTLATT